MKTLCSVYETFRSIVLFNYKGRATRFDLCVTLLVIAVLFKSFVVLDRWHASLPKGFIHNYLWCVCVLAVVLYLNTITRRFHDVSFMGGGGSDKVFL